MVSDDPHGPGLMVYDHIGGDNRALTEYIRWSGTVHGNDSSDAIRRVESIEAYLDHAPVHVAFSGRCEPMRELARALDRELGSLVKLFPTLYPPRDFGLVDVVHPQASKGAGVAAAAAELAITNDEVMAIGDNLNDIEMLNWAGTAVAMANAEPGLSSLEGVHLTASNDEDGVALAIERFVLQS